MKFVMCLVLLSISLSSFAQSRSSNPRIDLGGGRSTIRVDIGTDRTDANQNERIRRLEEAVRDLQYQVYDLRDQPQTTVITMNVCSLRTAFGGVFVGRAITRVEAEAQARNKCQNARVSFCTNTRVDCEIVNEVVTIR
jgi:hypothetical protein